MTIARFVKSFFKADDKAMIVKIIPCVEKPAPPKYYWVEQGLLTLVGSKEHAANSCHDETSKYFN